jgi:predicted anti-sigma-YlaC factor YlaD
MKYYCEKCRRLYDTIAEVENCEDKHRDEEARQAVLAKEREHRLKETNEAIERANKLRLAYIRDYSVSNSIFDILDEIIY